MVLDSYLGEWSFFSKIIYIYNVIKSETFRNLLLTEILCLYKNLGLNK